MANKIAALLHRRKSRKGFTLVELVIVIAVLVIIAGIAIPTVHNVVDNANKAADDSNAQAVELAIKTTASEIKSGQKINDPFESGKILTWNDSSGDDATVADALKLNGLGNDLPTVKQTGTSLFKYYYTTTGKIIVADSKPTDGTELTKDLKLNAVVPNT